MLHWTLPSLLKQDWPRKSHHDPWWQWKYGVMFLSLRRYLERTDDCFCSGLAIRISTNVTQMVNYITLFPLAMLESLKAMQWKSTIKKDKIQFMTISIALSSTGFHMHLSFFNISYFIILLLEYKYSQLYKSFLF